MVTECAAVLKVEDSRLPLDRRIATNQQAYGPPRLLDEETKVPLRMGQVTHGAHCMRNYIMCKDSGVYDVGRRFYTRLRTIARLIVFEIIDIRRHRKRRKRRGCHRNIVAQERLPDGEL